MKANQLFVLVIGAAAGCGVVSLPHPGEGSGSGSDMGSAMGSDMDPAGSHPPGTLYGHIIDERGDALDFSAGWPVHTHAGAAVDLSTGCSEVYKYAYLTTRQPPAFGREVTPNPLAFRIQTDPAMTDTDASAYRVRTDDGQTLLDWTPMMPADGDGVFTMTLHRDDTDQMKAIGTKVGKMYIDARIRDTSGNDTMTTACWQNHPLAAPLEVGAIGDGALFGMTFAAGSPISSVLNTDGLSIATLPIVQTTAEPLMITFATPKPEGTGSETAVTAKFVTSVTTVNLACGPVLVEPGCDRYVPLHTALAGSDPLDGSWRLALVDDATGIAVCSATGGNLTTTCAIPARGVGEAVRGYHAVLMLSAASIAPIANTSFGEYLANSTRYTGTVPVSGSGCSQVRVHVSNNIEYTSCVQSTSYVSATAFDTAHIDLAPITLSMTSSVGEPVLPAVHPTSLVFAAHSWDAGNTGL